MLSNNLKLAVEAALEAGRTIFETMLGIERKQNVNQTSIFDYE